MKIFSYFLFISLIFLNSSASGNALKGKISDSNGLPLTGAGIYILSPVDSTTISGTVSDTTGNFSIRDIPEGKVLIKISFIGFRDLYISKDINKPFTNLGNLVLNEKSSSLNEVNITEKVPPVQMKGDTVQYNADAYKTNRDATSEDLVNKMPGITSQDGKVQAQGEDVKKVLIDGKPFLGDDPNAALKNLPAEVVEKIQVFDKKSDQAEFTGFDDGNSTKTMNIVTRPQFRNGTFGKFFSGFGKDDNGNDNGERWKCGFNVNSFKDKRKFSILGNANNINEQNFSSDDLLGVLSSSTTNRSQQQGSFGPRPGGSGGGGGRYQPQNDASNFLVDPKNGIAKTYSGGINYTNQVKKTDFSVSYFYNNSENNATSNLVRQYFTSENNNLTYLENNSGVNKNINHRSNMKLEYKFDTTNSILIQPRISIQNNKSNKNFSGNNSDAVGQISNTSSLYNSDLDGLSFSTPLLYRHSFNKRGRTFSTNLVAGFNRNNGNSGLNSSTIYAIDSIPGDTSNQISDINSRNWNYSSEITYTEPVKSKGQLSFTYKGSYAKSISDKTTFTYSPSDGLYNTLDSSLSNKFKSDYLTQSAGASYRYQSEKWNATAGLTLQQATLKNNQEFPEMGIVDKTYNSVLPNAMLQYRFTLKKNLRVYYRSFNNPPSISQLQEVINNNNPLQLSTGNPSLKQDWQNNLNLRYSAINSDKKTSFFIFLSGTYTTNYIGNSSFIASSDTVIDGNISLANGAQISKPVNLDGYYSLRSFGNYSFPINPLKSMLNLNANVIYSRTPGMINDILNYSTSISEGFGFALSSNISEKIDFLLSSNGNVNSVRNTIQDKSNSDYFNLNSKFRTQVMPWKGLVLQTDINHQFNSGLSQNYNQNYFLWNAAIGYKFLKNKVAELRLSIFDILKQNKNITRNTTDLYYEDVQTNVLNQYFMLTFTYNLKFYKVAKE